MNKVKIERWTYRICFVIGMLAAPGLGSVPEVYGCMGDAVNGVAGAGT